MTVTNRLAFFSFCIYIESMTTTYKLNTRELESAFIDTIRTTYPNQVVEIEVREPDTTEYLLSSPANRERLMEAIKNVEDGKIITFDSVEQARQRAEELAGEN